MPVIPLWNRTDDDLTPFQRLLRAYMERSHIWTQRGLARKVGIPMNTVNLWFTRGYKPRIESLSRISAATDIPLAALYEALGYPLPTPVPPRPAAPPSPPPFEPGQIPTLWEGMARNIINDDRIPPDAKADLLAMMSQVQYGYDPMAHYIVAEHTVDAGAEPERAERPNKETISPHD